MITEDKKEWKNKLETCWLVAETLQSCVRGSTWYEKLNGNQRKVVSFNTGPAYLKHRLDVMAGYTHESELSKVFNDESSNFRQNSQEIFEGLDADCQILSLSKCIDEEYSADAMRGHFDNLEVNHRKFSTELDRF